MWRPIDTEFHGPRLPVGIADVGGDGVGLRNLLEGFKCVVHLHLIGTPGDFIKVISQGAAVPRYLFIEGHGTEDGLHFGTDAFDATLLKGESLPPSVIRERVDLPGATVVNLSCLGGERAMAEAFLAGRIQAYIGCRDYVDGFAQQLFVANFIYNVNMRQLSDRDAWHRAVLDTDHPEVDLISFYHADGKEERFVRDGAQRIHA